MADHVRAAHLGRAHLHRLHDRALHPEEVVHPRVAARAATRRHAPVVVLHGQTVPSAEQVRQPELGARS